MSSLIKRIGLLTVGSAVLLSLPLAYCTPKDLSPSESTTSCLIKNLSVAAQELPAELKWATFHLSDIFNINTSNMPVSRRGLLRYFINLHLEKYDFTNKTVLDVGAGKSPFVPGINKYYGDRGAKAVAVDIEPRTSQPTDQYVSAYAWNMPFKDGTFDLTVSSWFVNNIPNSEAKTFERILDEMIRVTKDGGEIRLLRTIMDPRFMSVKNLSAQVKSRNPRVDRVESSPAGYMRGYYRIVLKK